MKRIRIVELGQRNRVQADRDGRVFQVGISTSCNGYVGLEIRGRYIDREKSWDSQVNDENTGSAAGSMAVVPASGPTLQTAAASHVGWEYKSLVIVGSAELTLKQLGEEGWELAAAIPESGTTVPAFCYYFKRPKR